MSVREIWKNCARQILNVDFFCLGNDTKKPRVGKMFAKSDKDIRVVRREETNEKLKISAKKTATKISWIRCWKCWIFLSLSGEVLINIRREEESPLGLQNKTLFINFGRRIVN